MIYYETELGRLYLGDSFRVVRALTERFKVVILDPPYVKIADKRASNWEYNPMGMILRDIYYRLRDDGVIFYFGTPQHFIDNSDAIRRYYRVWFDLIWVKPQGVNFVKAKERPLCRHENIWCLVKKDARLSDMTYNYRDIGEYGKPYVNVNRGNTYEEFIDGEKPRVTKSDGFRYPTTVIEVKNKVSLDDSERTPHPTQKPIKLIEKLILGWSNEGDYVLDPFMGSGTTAVVCEDKRRKWIGIEIEERWCEVIKNRLKALRNQRTITYFL